MRGISCLLNFKENLTKNLPYYRLLSRQICVPEQEPYSQEPCILEHAAFCSDSNDTIISRVCEGYQFTVAFSGVIASSNSAREELSAYGYPFLFNNDAELALLSYIHFGESCSHKLSGNFSLVVYDSMRRNVFALSKGYDALPIFYGNIGDFYMISTFPGGILSFPHIQKSLNSDLVLSLLSARNRLPAQIFNGISALPRNSFLKISQKGIQKTILKDEPPCPKNDYTKPIRMGLVFTDSKQDNEFLRALEENDILKCRRINVYAEKIPSSFGPIHFHCQHLSIDEGTVYSALETVVSACGFPFLSDFDYILSIALKRSKGTDEALYFATPDLFYPPKNYTATLIKNDAFHSALEKNLQEFTPTGDIFPSYPSLISNFMSMEVNTLPWEDTQERPLFSYPHTSQKLKTTLRRILLDIISKEHSPLLAFFKRSALLRLCEGGFVFKENESETELTAYLIKLNMWFEIFSPKII